MRDWFKARNAWGAVFISLPDEDAGKLAKLLWDYTMNGVIPEGNGYLGGLFAMMRITLDQDREKETEISAKRSAAAAARNVDSAANAANDTKPAIAANDDNKNKNKNKSKSKSKNQEQESESKNNNEENNNNDILSLSDEEVAEAIARDQKIEEAAMYVGLKVSAAAMNKARDLAFRYGLPDLLEAINASIDVPNWSYVEGILRNNQKAKKEADREAEQNEKEHHEYMKQWLIKNGNWDEEYQCAKDQADKFRERGLTPEEAREEMKAKWESRIRQYEKFVRDKKEGA